MINVFYQKVVPLLNEPSTIAFFLGLNKYNNQHQSDHFGGKSGNHANYHDGHLYTRNRGCMFSIDNPAKSSHSALNIHI